MNNRSWVENMIRSIIILNILLLVLVFLIPRAKIIVSHWDEKPEVLMETLGAMDTPNQYSRTYKVANEIRNITEENSIILMPTDNWEFGSNRSVVIQRLYPRKVYFFGDERFYDHKNSSDFQTTVYAAGFFGDGANLCSERDKKRLGETKFILCTFKN